MRAIQCYFIQCYQKDREPKGPGQWNGPVSDMTVTFRGMRSLLRDCDGKFPSPNVNESTTFGSISSARLLEALRINVTFHLTSAQDARGEYDPLQKCHVERLRWFEVCVFHVFSHMVAINCPTFDTPKKKANLESHMPFFYFDIRLPLGGIGDRKNHLWQKLQASPSGL